jgi:histidinol-phosphate aminotransferase
VLKYLEAPQVRFLGQRIAQVVRERTRLAYGLAELPGVREILPSQANFILVRASNPDAVVARARSAGLLVRDVRAEVPGALRITVGTVEQNDRLLEAWA